MIQTLSVEELRAPHAKRYLPSQFSPARHFYPRVLNATMHPLVASFMRQSHHQIAQRYCHLNPRVDLDTLLSLLQRCNKQLQWAGTDLFYTTTDQGVRRMIVVETNSCPSGNKSTPILSEDDERGGYSRLLTHAFLPLLRKRNLPKGGLAVLYDKNGMEASGYAAALADLTGEPVYLTPMPSDQLIAARFDQGVLSVMTPEGAWTPIRAAFRYVTQRPWNRIPCATRTVISNPIIGCLAGGRNKLIAATAYELLNAQLAESGLEIRTPETVRGVSFAELPLWVERFGGYAVIKNPYSNAGQGVWTITSQRDFDEFRDAHHTYDQFIVQALIGNSQWSSVQRGARHYHVGTMPNRRGDIFVADLRMTVASGPDGFKPVAIYARRTSTPLPNHLDSDQPSWPILGTNLSISEGGGAWSADTDRLLLMDSRDFNKLGVGIDDLVEGYIQAVLSSVAIDEMAIKLSQTRHRGKLKRRLFQSLNQDPKLFSEIIDFQVEADLRGALVDSTPSHPTELPDSPISSSDV